MARYTDDSRERVRDAVDFAELVGARTELRAAGQRRLTGLCPFHDERTPSFGIDPVEKLYHCFGCGAGGDVFKFVMETEGLDFAGALESLAARAGVELERDAEDPRDAERRQRRERLLALLERTAAYYVRLLWESADAARARAPEDQPKSLNTAESELFHKGRLVYGADIARAAAAKAGRVVLVEGYTDVIALRKAGVPEAVCSMGTALTPQQVDALARLAPKVLFCQDPA